ncbi:cellulose binding domain-containing protein [Micromonospora eburnea]|uniref:Cellulose binding domain-containing protein n=1 Tax=Micromonospora eburnea TaxID=227316 RepID=A0A1C6U9M9_9ACTN|nr:cellulose binding domain-containing protein [Micromonospora eburnea]SCL50668.1 Cellulose binding domain-containing protein [Micromonospora eburnea]
MTQTWKTLSRATAAGLLAASVALAVPAGGVAAPPAASDRDATVLDLIPADTRDAMLAQAPLVDAATGIKAAVGATTRPGFAGIGLVGDHVVLWWKGSLPSDVAAAVATARRIAPVEVTAARYSRGELAAAAARLAPVADRHNAVHGVRLRADGSGVEVAVEPGATPPKLPGTGVRTTVVRAEELTPRSREDDSAPWSGGARIWAGAGCSTGFGVRDAASSAGYLLSAGHCGDIGAQWTDGAGEPIGTQTHKNADHDTMLISTPSPGGHVYVGGSHDTVRARVTGWTEVFPGQLLCQSGATSAWAIGRPICNLRVEFHYDDREDLVEATQLDGEDSARSGDSGGPVYAVNADGTILAAGTTTRSAGPGFGFQDFATARDDFGDLVPVTGAQTSTCRVSYVVTDSWATGFAAAVTIYNDGPARTGWNLSWTFDGGQLVQGHWGGVFNQTGSAVRVSNDAWNASLPAGGSVSVGFTADGPATIPASFQLDGDTCS